MRHEAFNERMHELLDRRQRPEADDELRALAEISPEFHAAFVAQQRMLEGLEADDLPELPPHFAEQVVARVLTSPASPQVSVRRWRKSWIFELGAVAALVLVALVAGSRFAPAAREDAPHVARSLPQPTSPATDVGASVPSPTPSSPSGVDAAAPAATAAANRRRYDEIYQAILDRSQPEELLAHRPQWVDEVALGLRPVATSLGGAINTLRSTLPPSSKSDRPEKPQALLLENSSTSALV